MYSTQEQRTLFDLSKKLLEGPTLFDTDDPAARAYDLARVIRYHEWRYYVLNNPVISDYEYDQLYKQLQELEEERLEQSFEALTRDLWQARARYRNYRPLL